MNLHVPMDLQCIANGQLVDQEVNGQKAIYRWRQEIASPAYTFGFAIGRFHKHAMKHGNTKIVNYASDYSSNQLAQIFRETPEMIAFFEGKTGIPYDQESYIQLLMGDYYQEMSGFSLLKESYGDYVLKDSTETNLISHELAHQWWGNRITCESFNHFWLNEAFATFMSAAYNEHRFGEEKYASDINAYLNVYEGIKSRNNDKSLVFDQWTNPSRDDRNIVYFKGAYVLHVLRKELRDELFWKGIKLYSQRYFDKTVTTRDFQQTMEEAAGKELDYFFNEWGVLRLINTLHEPLPANDFVL